MIVPSLFIGLSYQFAFATTTFVSMSGVSNQNVETISAGTTGTTTTAGTTTIKAFGGYTGAYGDCASGTTATCDSCNVSDAMHPCNHNAVTPTTRFHVDMTTDNSGTSGTIPAYVIGVPDTGTGTVHQDPEVAPPVGGGAYSFDTPWSAICTVMANDPDCKTPFSGSLQIGLSQEGTTILSGEEVTIQIAFNYVDGSTTSTYARCDAGTSTSGDGFCFFNAFPGDAKIYLDDTQVASNFPTATTGVKWSNLTVFYEQAASGEAAQAVLARIRPNSPNQTLSFDNSQTTDPSFDNRVTGLTNDQRYCFLMANQDETGTISKWANYSGGDYTAGTAKGQDDDLFCATPEQVYGLLDDKKCFIATAAFGSALDPHVATLRQFRDQFLKPSSLGRSFIAAYYDNSPPFAHYIAHHEGLRMAVRWALWPFVGFASLSLQFGLAAPLALVGLFIALSLLSRRWLQRRLGQR